jgi:hypothetical protein
MNVSHRPATSSIFAPVLANKVKKDLEDKAAGGDQTALLQIAKNHYEGINNFSLHQDYAITLLAQLLVEGNENIRQEVNVYSKEKNLDLTETMNNLETLKFFR